MHKNTMKRFMFIMLALGACMMMSFSTSKTTEKQFKTTEKQSQAVKIAESHLPNLIVGMEIFILAKDGTVEQIVIVTQEMRDNALADPLNVVTNFSDKCDYLCFNGWVQYCCMNPIGYTCEPRNWTCGV